MSAFDLVPESYRRTRRLRRTLVRFGIGYGAVAICLLAAKSFLSVRIDAEATELERLRVDKNSMLEQRIELDTLAERRGKLESRLATLDTLRGGPPIERVFEAVGRIVSAEVWFLDWRFLRAGEFVEPGTKPTGGYLLVVPPGAGSGGERAWRLKTHMEIKGQALTHSALAEFVQRLSADPIIAEVKLINTRSRRYTSREVVDFELAVLIAAA